MDLASRSWGQAQLIQPSAEGVPKVMDPDIFDTREPSGGLPAVAEIIFYAKNELVALVT